jgi:hypothetical protein
MPLISTILLFHMPYNGPPLHFNGFQIILGETIIYLEYMMTIRYIHA